MSLRLEMLQVARLAPALLGDAGELVEAFVRSQQADDGGFLDRDGKSDLYYTSFAIDALSALVDSLEGRLGENEATLRQARAQLQQAFVAASKAAES